MPNYQKIIASSHASGFKNTDSKTITGTLTGAVLAPGGITYTTLTTNIPNSNAICQVQILYGGLETDYKVINGNTLNYYAFSTYQIQSFYYFSGTTLTIWVLAADNGGGSTVPTISLTARAFMFVAPF